MNPLLDFSGLPRFAEIRPEHVTPAVDELLAACRKVVEDAMANKAEPSWQNFVAPMEDANERLSRAWGQVSHLHSVMDSPELREVYNENLPKITQYYAELGQHEGLFRKFRELKRAIPYATLTHAQQQIVERRKRTA
jgi:oligopeptidase A